MKSTLQHKSKSELRANFNLLFEFMLAVAGVVIVAILVFSVNEDAREDLVVDSIGYNATIDGDEAAAKVPARLPLLGTAVVFGVVLYVVFRVIPFRASGMSGGYQ